MIADRNNHRTCEKINDISHGLKCHGCLPFLGVRTSIHLARLLGAEHFAIFTEVLLLALPRQNQSITEMYLLTWSASHAFHTEWEALTQYSKEV